MQTAASNLLPIKLRDKCSAYFQLRGKTHIKTQNVQDLGNSQDVY